MATLTAENLSREPQAVGLGLGLRERQRQARGAAILEAAFALIVERGYDALTMEAVAARVGISRQTLYLHFKSRDEIALRAVLTLVEEGITAIRAVERDESLLPLERLRRVVREMIERKAEPFSAALVRARQSLASVLSHPEYQAAAERRLAALAGMVAAAQAAGAVRRDLEDRIVARMLLGVVSAACREDSLPDVARAMCDVFFSGLRPEK